MTCSRLRLLLCEVAACLAHNNIKLGARSTGYSEVKIAAAKEKASSKGDAAREMNKSGNVRQKLPIKKSISYSPAIEASTAAKTSKELIEVVLRAKQLPRVYGLNMYIAAIRPLEPVSEPILRSIFVIALLVVC